MDNIRTLVKALGGDEAVATQLSAMSIKTIGRRSVEKWGDKNYVPYFWRPALSHLAKQNDLDADHLLSWGPVTRGQDAA
jgi:hypothetical protein